MPAASTVAELGRYAGAELHRPPGVGHAHEKRIADRLDLLTVVLREQTANREAEIDRHVGRAVVAHRLGERRVADQIRK